MKKSHPKQRKPNSETISDQNIRTTRPVISESEWENSNYATPASPQLVPDFYLIFTSPEIGQARLPVLNSTVSLLTY